VARRKKPSIIFIDDIDSLALTRTSETSDSSRRIKAELFIQMDGAFGADNEGIFVMGATSTPQDLDDAFLRRFDKLIYVPLPTIESRFNLFKQRFSHKEDSNFTDQNFWYFASRTDK
jgi:vacuolar protein-sorting-associated protein 4